MPRVFHLLLPAFAAIMGFVNIESDKRVCGQPNARRQPMIGPTMVDTMIHDFSNKRLAFTRQF